MLSLYWILACLFAGVLTFLSPCVLPVLPIVFSTSLGRSKWRPFWIVLGLVLSFTILGICLSFLGHFLGLTPQAIRWAALGLLFAAGILFLFPEFSARLFQPLIRRFGHSSSSSESIWGALGIGASLGAVWTPCAGPIFAFVLSAALLQRHFFDSLVLLLAYAVGAGLPMLAVGYLGNRLVKKIRSVAKYENKIRRFSGALLVTAAIVFSLGLDTRLIATLPVSWLDLSKVEGKIVNELKGEGKVPFGGIHEERGELAVLGQAPEIEGIEAWINSGPLRRDDLKGQVVLVDFWTYSCINCLRTLPFVKQWYQSYKDQGFVVVGIHTPEFAFEKDLKNVSKAVKDLGISYPVGLDNAYATWKNFDNHYWPAHYLIDAQGKIRYTHFGEGEYDRTEEAIRSLLMEKGKALKAIQTPLPRETVDFSRVASPETYLGFNRMERFNSPESVWRNEARNYSLAKVQPLNTWSLGGSWKIEGERALNLSSQAKLRFQFEARKINLVLSSPKPAEVVIRLDGKVVDSQTAGRDVKEGKAVIQEPRLYELIDLRNQGGEHLFEIEFLSPHVEGFAFTFG